MRWEDRRPGQERANNQRGYHLPEAPTVPPILTADSRHENPSVLKKELCDQVFLGKNYFRGAKWQETHCALPDNTDRHLVGSCQLRNESAPETPPCRGHA